MTVTRSRPDAELRGLSSEQAVTRRDRYGRNELPEPRPRRLPARIGAQLRDPLVLVLLAAMTVTAALRDVPDLIVIALVIVLNTTVGVVQEVRADHAVAALRRLAAPVARVRRDGRDMLLAAAELVPDDVVRVEAGDVVPADMLLHDAARLTVDEAALTGESVPVVKTDDSELAAGTVVATGRGTGTVVRTGKDSALGRIAALVADQPYRATPLQRRLAGLGRALAIAAAGLSTVVLISGLLRGLPLAKMVLAAVSLTVAAVPESLPAVVTVALALGARRMAAQAAIVRRLPAVETLGSVTVIAADKTGTLTQGVMSVERLALPDGTIVELSGDGYEPAPARPVPAAATELARAIVLCNDAELAPPDSRSERWTPVGDPMEAALLAAAARCGVSRDMRARYPRLSELPFDAQRLRMSTVHRRPDGGFLVVGKGAPEMMLAEGGPVDIDPAVRDRALAAAHHFATDGYRVLAVAGRSDQHRPDNPEQGLQLLGLVALIDPVRPQAAETAAAFRRAGIRLVLITGDHPATATAIATRVGLSTDRVVLGEALRPDDATNADIFARTRPEQKLTIVGGLQDAGEVVAMTGDGVNDAPALRAADIGVAMGGSGTEAARQAADLVLADDNLASVGAAVAEGRRIYTNIRRFLVYGLSGGLAEVLVMLAGPFAGLSVPLLPAQILWINMLTHGLPGVALGAEPADRSAMQRPPRPPGQAILGGGLGWRIAGTGTLIAGVALTAAVVAAAAGRPWQTVLFTVLGLAQLGVALALRTRARPRNWSLDAAVALSLVLQLAAVWLSPLHALLGTTRLSIVEILACAAVAAVPALVTVLISRRRN